MINMLKSLAHFEAAFQMFVLCLIERKKGMLSFTKNTFRSFLETA
ncbi:hypothetical protein ADIARSV_1219 [Arcticibacter svalbardensis MN12-7]|uniref:Uncharacterized protein n=1 Tax=Arcticibacter svalbardensis MN12-7 TaxID=1150600 RepID=R9GVB6_9SPHI|nr:hypothetical protein ADIARSV_1219 [Arcticibacter svalbardensis MN12-7]